MCAFKGGDDIQLDALVVYVCKEAYTVRFEVFLVGVSNTIRASGLE